MTCGFNKSMGANAPCHGCAERKIGCHSICEQYKDFKAKTEHLREQRIEFCKATDALIEIKKAGAWRNG